MKIIFQKNDDSFFVLNVFILQCTIANQRGKLIKTNKRKKKGNNDFEEGEKEHQVGGYMKNNYNTHSI